MLEKRKLYIDGQWVSAGDAPDIIVMDPSTEEPCAVISAGSAGDVDRAVRAARRAFPAWSRTSPEHRRTLLVRLDEIMQRRLAEWGQSISLEMGAPIDFAIESQAACGPWHMQGFLAAFDRFEWEHDLPGKRERIAREPIGVCGLITPWNWPANQIALKVIPALATGCTCILKPSEIAPLSAMLFAEMVHEAGFPAGVFNLVNGDGATAGAALSEHPDVDMMSFTGSTRAGALVSKAAADTVKRVTLELGGKSPNILFADCDLDDALQRGIEHVFENTGQSCNAPTRMLVERGIYG